MNTQEIIEMLERGRTGWALDGYVSDLTLGKGADHLNATTSLDAALALLAEVLPGWGVCEAKFGELYRDADIGISNGAQDAKGRAPTPAVALCIAILRAVEAKEQD